MAMAPVPAHELIVAPALAAGGVDQLTTRVVLVAFVPAQVPEPKTVRVALNEPAVALDGVKVQEAGLVVLVFVQVPVPPLHATEPKVPDTVAPVIGCGAVPQVTVFVPTLVMDGAGAQFTTFDALAFVPVQWLFPKTVTVSVY